MEFDKEINAILRKVGKQPAATAVASPHIDADVMAAFAENALPDRARPPLIEHFAACDNCRKMLSQTISLNAEAGATAASSVVGDVPIGVTVPWYQKLFRTPGLALAMGALVVVFTVVLGYIGLQNRNANNTAVSEVKEPEQTRGGPYDSGAPSSAAANSVSNAIPMSNSTMSSSNGMPSNANTTVLSTNTTVRRQDAGELKTAEAPADERSPFDSVAGKPAAPAGGVQPPPPAPVTMADVSKTEDDEKKADKDKLRERGGNLDLAARKESEESRVSRDAPMAAAKVGPSRSGPLQMKSNQVGSGASEMSVTRVVGGKTFSNREGAWYDNAYHSQSTTDVHRGSAEFKKLDGGLKSIANKLGGVVVVVWKAKAYRIQ